jgi:hypothetical protein
MSCIIESIKTIKKAFPALPLSFYDVLTDRLRAAGFSDQRLFDAVSYVIDSCIYPMPTIAQFISFDKKIKIYTYHQYCQLINEGDNGDNYKAIKFKDNIVLVWIHINDIKKYNIKSQEDE